MAAVDDFELVVEPYHQALGEIIKGNPECYKELYSHRDNVTLANPFGPAARGWEQVAATMERAASQFRDGEITSIEEVAKYVTPKLAYLVEMERYEAKLGGREDLTPVALRVTYFATSSMLVISPSLNCDAARSMVAATCSHPRATGPKGLARVTSSRWE